MDKGSHGAGRQEREDSSSIDLDCPSFSAQKYAGRVLQKEDLKGAVRACNVVGEEVKTLNADLQMLVYENYAKFISATDASLKVKSTADEMHSDIDSLSASIEEMARLDADFAAEKLAEMQDFTELRRLLQKAGQDSKIAAALQERGQSEREKDESERPPR
uniref:Vacuolar protein sorting-associated protein 51 homolog n=1 Tax=Chromera velia CCMP2878 TaxID=1169474 RepID=A0A0G4H735_9ALVE|mmetsp:Transcript_55416/g.108483  ORF Transcript_55416/g.108483 Transcript_55416/m.108483 type:complete len:161 (-) Transcript_55416:211-693(-)|eukprot:Cvel_24976.t1-p1 / transcript=Cvel_24976.t1 / gene=Cvel_24976 / organism=Chromera_velia_CCMP2878 / gene_product=Vacuolar protein sorting-associated protein 51, putative / transcript_product=Vacuolar protein sorting-associated protein 51, putative / location=Cvel_scaffold2767:3546-4855(-) / protein_length=160 / sequence_SO=supercontig / SO=protein_coding / is_pseudo=false